MLVGLLQAYAPLSDFCVTGGSRGEGWCIEGHVVGASRESSGHQTHDDYG